MSRSPIIIALFIVVGLFSLEARAAAKEGTRQLSPAATLLVTKTADTNDGVCDADCSLREAVAVAVSGDTIQFASPHFDTAQAVQVNGQITINKSLSIVGRGAALTTLQNIATPSSTSRIFLILGGTVSISRMSLTGANLSEAATLPGCTQICGGAIYNTANLTLNETVFHGNQLTGTDTSNRLGGAVTSTGTLTVSSSTFFNNSIASAAQSFMYGGALASAGSTLIVNSTFSNNSISSSGSSFVQLFGGGFVSLNGSMTVLNSTVANNRLSATAANAQCFGGGALIATKLVGNTLIAGNGISCLGFTSGPDVDGFNSLGNNLIGNYSGANITGTTTGNILNQNPHLAPLGYYGDATPTHALLSGSPAIDAGNNCVTNQSCASSNPPTPLTTDQRGASRIGQVDIGAFEANSSANGGNFRGRLPDGLINAPYNFTLVPSNGTTTYAVTGGALPPGMNLTTALAPNAVVSLAGTPTSGGIFNFTVTATNGANTSVTDYRLDIVNPTAAGVSVSGRVMTNEGRGLANAVVILTDASGESRSVRTGSFGLFRFDDVAAGQTVVVEVRSKRFSFAPQVVFVGDEVANLEFVGDR